MKSFSLIFLLFLSYTFTSFGQSKYELFKNDLHKDWELLSAYPYGFENLDLEELGLEYLKEEDLSFENFDPDSLVKVMVRKTTDYLKSVDSRDINWEDFPSTVEIKADSTRSFHVLDFHYNSGGSAGIIPQPLIIKEDGDSLRIFDLTQTECLFDRFYELKENTYLCIGHLVGWSFCYNTRISVIDFGGDIEKYEDAFLDSPSYIVCNSEVDYNHEKKLLTIHIDFIPLLGTEDCKTYFAKEEAEGFSVDCIEDQEGNAFSAILTTRYDGDKFVKP